jgi:hypothetical protein
MNTRELRIGNWVKWMGKECKVDLPLLETEFGDSDYSKYVEPIELTEDMLLDNGFRIYVADMIEPNKSYTTFKKDKVEIIKRPFYDPASAYGGIEYKILIQDSLYYNSFFSKSNAPFNVHELQNAYYLVNKQELDFKP